MQRHAKLGGDFDQERAIRFQAAREDGDFVELQPIMDEALFDPAQSRARFFGAVLRLEKFNGFLIVDF